MGIVYRFFTILVSIILLCCHCAFGISINLFIKQAPLSVQRSVKKELSVSNLDRKTPGQIGGKIFKAGLKQAYRNMSFMPQQSGFAAIYGGYVDYSDQEGTITFPLLQKQEKIYLVITKKIELFTIYGNTISHRNLTPGVPAKIYLFERKRDETKDKKGKTIAKGPFYWEVTETPRPTDNQIDPLSIVLITKPQNIVVPTGAFITAENANFVLPSIYVVGNLENVKNMLNFFDIRRFFEQVDRKEKIEQKHISQKKIQNL